MNDPFADLISRGEGNYNSYNRGRAGDAHSQTIDFSKMTLAEVQDYQRLDPKDPDRIFAVGKYQIIPGTMTEAVKNLKLDPAQKFTPELQEKIFADYLISVKQHAIGAYIRGQPGASLHSAQRAASREWASVEDPSTPGKPYAAYIGVGNNHASITSDEVAAALNAMRTEYQSSIAKGMNPDDAWKAVTATDGTLTKTQQQSADHVSHRGSLRQGDHSEAVGITQQELRDLGYTDAKGRPLAVDNDFGPATRAAIKAFQHDHGLANDGIVGRDTASALTSQVDALQKNTGPDLHSPDPTTISKDSSMHDMFEAICAAANKGDTEGLCAVGHAYAQSPEGQAFVSMGAQMNQAQVATKQAQQMLMQPQVQVPQGPAMAL